MCMIDKRDYQIVVVFVYIFVLLMQVNAESIRGHLKYYG